MGGLAFPGCSGQPEACAGSTEPGPSLRALVLYQGRRFGVGVLGRVERLHWSARYTPYVAPPAPMGTVDSNLTTGLIGFAGRYTMLPDAVVSPVLELAFGAAFQTQSGSNFTCSTGLSPGAEAALGARARFAKWGSVFALASAHAGIPSSACGVSDGAPATPFVGNGLGLHAGLAFDVGQP